MPDDPVSHSQQWTPDDAEELFAKTLAQLIRELPKGRALRVYNRPDHKGKPYVMVHAHGAGARYLQELLIDKGLIKVPPDPTLTKRTKA